MPTLLIRQAGVRSADWPISAPGRAPLRNNRMGLVRSATRRVRRSNASSSASVGCVGQRRHGKARPEGAVAGARRPIPRGQSMRAIALQDAPGGLLSRAGSTCGLTLSRYHGFRLVVGGHPGLRNCRLLSCLISLSSSWQRSVRMPGNRDRVYKF